LKPYINHKGTLTKLTKGNAYTPLAIIMYSIIFRTFFFVFHQHPKVRLTWLQILYAQYKQIPILGNAISVLGMKLKRG